MNTICLDERYSTTRLLAQDKSEIVNSPEDKFESVLFLPEGEGRKGVGGLRTQGYFKKSYEDKPLISIVTVVYNGEKFLEETIQSVINQTYDNIEYIVIDGGSTDGTLDIVKKYEEQIDYWVSEPDNGIYDAMNKGLTLATGEYIGILNADDYYMNDSIRSSIETLINRDKDYVMGKVRMIPSNIVISPTYPLTENIYQGMMYPHIGTFIKKEVYTRVGLFDTSYKVSADFDMAMKIHRAGFQAINSNIIVGNVLEGGISAGFITKKENMNIAIKYGRNAFLAKILFYKYTVKRYLYNILPLALIRAIKN